MPLLDEAVRVYPNPTSGEISIVGLPSTRRYLYEVYTFVGQKVTEGSIQGESTIKLSTLMSGKYIFLLKSEEGNEVLHARLLVLKWAD